VHSTKFKGGVLHHHGDWSGNVTVSLIDRNGRGNVVTTEMLVPAAAFKAAAVKLVSAKLDNAVETLVSKLCEELCNDEPV
jgi:hypothetical protein